MYAELTSEEIVTRLLTSEEVLRRTTKDGFVTSPSNLREYLDSNLIEEDEIAIKEESYEEPQPTRYTFIRQVNDKIFG